METPELEASALGPYLQTALAVSTKVRIQRSPPTNVACRYVVQKTSCLLVKKAPCLMGIHLRTGNASHPAHQMISVQHAKLTLQSQKVHSDLNSSQISLTDHSCLKYHELLQKSRYGWHWRQTCHCTVIEGQREQALHCSVPGRQAPSQFGVVAQLEGFQCRKRCICAPFWSSHHSSLSHVILFMIIY